MWRIVLKKPKSIFNVAVIVMVFLFVVPCLLMAEETEDTAESGAAALAAKFQNPLAALKAVFTDNAIGFDTGADGGTSYGFQIQPVYAIDFPERGLTFIPRAVIPILGLEPGTSVPPTGGPTPTGTESVWGLGDTVLQFMLAPRLKSNWKWGVGPQVTLKTSTDSALGGPGWGAGIAGILTNGSVIPNLSSTVLVSQIWSFDGDFSTATIQPSFFYNFPAVPGLFVSYTGVISANWKADSANTWTVPLGLSIGRTFDLGGGYGLDTMIGPYYNVVRPDGAPSWSVRFGLSILFP